MMSSDESATSEILEFPTDTYSFEDDLMLGEIGFSSGTAAKKKYIKSSKKMKAGPSFNFDDLSPAAAGEELPNQFSSQLTKGMLAYDIPLDMVLWKTYRVELRVDDSVTTDGMSEFAETETIEMSTTMRAELSGQGFEIIPLNSDTQLRKFNKATVWKWDVKPNMSGTQTLKLKLVCVLKRAGFTDENYDLEVFEVDRKVKIDWFIFIKGLLINYWKAIIGFLFTSGLVAWLAKKAYKKIKNRNV